MPGSIRAKLLGLVIATVVPFLALIGGGLWSQWKTFHDAAVVQALTEARLLAAQVDDHIGNVENLLAGLSRAVSTDPADTPQNDELLRKVKSELPDFISDILLYARDGRNIGQSAPPHGQRLVTSGRTYLSQALDGRKLAISEVVHARLNGRWIVAAARPVEDRDGHIAAVLAIGTRLDRFQDALRSAQLPAGSVIRIVNDKGVVVAQNAHGPNWIGRDLSDLDDVRRHMTLKEASDVARWSDGTDRITGSSTADRVPWLVSVGLPTDVAFTTVLSRLTWGGIISAITIAAAFSIAWMLSGHIVRPLRRLSRDASLIAAGELSHRTIVRTNDEVGALADSFNRMAASIEKRRDETRRSVDELRQAKETLAAVIEASPVAIVFSNPDRKIALWNRAAEQIFGYTAEETIGHVIRTVPPEGAAASRAMFECALSGETIHDVQVRRMRKDGVMIDTCVSAAPLYDADGSIRGVAWVHEDITDRKKAEAQLKHQAHHDALTGLPNRVSLREELADLIAPERHDTPTSIALFDLDGFKDVNDTLGHSTGDRLLVEVGRRLGEAARGRGRVYRLGGDEFIAVIPGCGDPLVAGDVIDAMLKGLADPFLVNDHVLHLSGSAGLAIAPQDGTSVDQLIANADLALYQAKAEGRGNYRLFVPTLRARAQARRALDAELRTAFADNEFELHFQPQIRLADDTVAGAEALLRWRHPTRGMLTPGLFIETLAQSAIAADVGRWIIRTACEKAAQWRARGFPLERIGVNLFPVQLAGDMLVEQVEEALRETGLPPQALELEITENVALDYERAAGPLQRLHERGVRIAFDDFGTGFASLSYLTRFPLSCIKIDRGFVSKIGRSAKDAAIIRSIIAMAHSLALEVVAEGVETPGQAEFLSRERCEQAQGYLYAQPLSAEQFDRYLQKASLARDSGDDPLTAHGTA